MKHFIGVRIDDQEKQILDRLCKEFKKTPSQIIRHLLNESQGNEIVLQNLLKEVMERSDENCHQLQRLEELSRFTGSLLTSLVRKTSKSDPSEADRMIESARREVIRERKPKLDPVEMKKQ